MDNTNEPDGIAPTPATNRKYIEPAKGSVKNDTGEDDGCPTPNSTSCMPKTAAALQLLGAGKPIARQPHD